MRRGSAGGGGRYWGAPVSRISAAIRSHVDPCADCDHGSRGAGGPAGVGARTEGGLMIPLSYYLVLSAILFACGVTGFLIKRNIITIFLSIVLTLKRVDLSFVALSV